MPRFPYSPWVYGIQQLIRALLLIAPAPVSVLIRLEACTCDYLLPSSRQIFREVLGRFVAI